MHDGLWAAIDFETATREATSACALGVALIDGLEVSGTATWLIRPPFNEYEYRNTLIHGISAEDTEFAPEFDEVWFEILAHIKGRRIVAHNAAFDMRVLGALIRTRELPSPQIDYACTVAMARRAMPDLGNHKLDTVCGHCGIRLMHHDAGSDAEACARVAIECARIAGASCVGTGVKSLGVTLKTVA